MTTVRRRGTGGGGVEAKNEFKIENAGEPKQALVKISATTAEWSKVINGGEAAKATLSLESTSNAEKGKIELGPKGVWLEEKGSKGETCPKLALGLTVPIAFLQSEPGAAGVPEAVSTATGTEALKGFIARAPVGGNTTIATEGTGGAGSGMILETGKGGEATAAVTKSVGGAGGKLAITLGAGAKGLATSETANGGLGGELAVTGGSGGEGKGTVAGEGGKGSIVKFESGVGGKGTTGGSGGTVVFKAGGGGQTSGPGGQIQFTAGAGGSSAGNGGPILMTAGASVGAGLGGNIEFTAGKGGAAEGGGKIILKTEATARLTVATSGAVECQKGIGAFGKVPPSLQPVNPKTLKAVIEVIEGAGLAEAGTPTAAIEGTEGIFTNSLTLSGFPLSFVEEISVPEEVTEEATFTIPEAMAVPFGNVTLNGKLKVDGLLRDVEAAWPTFEESIMPIELPELSTFAVQANRQIPFGMLTTINGTIKLDGALLDY